MKSLTILKILGNLISLRSHVNFLINLCCSRTVVKSLAILKSFENSNFLAKLCERGDDPYLYPPASPSNTNLQKSQTEIVTNRIYHNNFTMWSKEAQ